MSWTWTCDPTSGACTLSSDLQAFATDVLQALWTIAGLQLAAIIVAAVVALLLVRIRG